MKLEKKDKAESAPSVSSVDDSEVSWDQNNKDTPQQC